MSHIDQYKREVGARLQLVISPDDKELLRLIKGDPGAPGRDGQSIEGAKGDTGPQGPQGKPGRDGVDGLIGKPGAAGRDGKDGRVPADSMVFYPADLPVPAGYVEVPAPDSAKWAFLWAPTAAPRILKKL